MNYYQTVYGVCFKMPESSKMREIVWKARELSNINLMIEQIHPCSLEDYTEYIEGELSRQKKEIERLELVIKHLRSKLPDDEFRI